MSRCWLILIACGCSALGALADEKPSLAPPADPPAPVPAPIPAAAKASPPPALPPVPASAEGSVPVSAPVQNYAASLLYPDKGADSAAPADDLKTRVEQLNSYLPDSVGALTIRPIPEPDEDEIPSFIKEAHYLKAHNDAGMAATYLGKVAQNPDLTPHDRARVILELSDLLAELNRPANELCWLKIWMQLYPARPEVGAVAYRMGTLYTKLGLSDLARDSFYLALSNAVNHGQVTDTKDLAQYTRLTVGTLWALAENEYNAGDWTRAAELFDRFLHEAQSAAPGSLARAEYLQADCYYQMRQGDKAAAAYRKALTDHPFQKLAPEAWLRLYHLDMLAKKPQDAQEELESMIWTVRTCWPKDEEYWQKRTGDLLMAINHDNGAVLPPLLHKSRQVSKEDKAWQAELGHYDKLANLEATNLQTNGSSAASSTMTSGLSEADDLLAMRRAIDALAPAPLLNPDHP